MRQRQRQRQKVYMYVPVYISAFEYVCVPVHVGPRVKFRCYFSDPDHENFIHLNLKRLILKLLLLLCVWVYVGVCSNSYLDFEMLLFFFILQELANQRLTLILEKSFE